MKKLTANVARKLSNKASTEIKVFQDAIDIIHLHTVLGMSNCFLDGNMHDLMVVQEELQQRGFRCFLEQRGVLNPEGPLYLTVEW